MLCGCVVSRVYVCMYVCMYVCIYVCREVGEAICGRTVCICMNVTVNSHVQCIFMYVYTYVCMYVYMYVCR